MFLVFVNWDFFCECSVLIFVLFFIIEIIKYRCENSNEEVYDVEDKDEKEKFNKK